MKTKETIKGREVAINELNQWFDELNVPEDMRLDIDFEAEEGEEIEESRIKKREKDDVMRERVIRQIMNGRLILNDNKQLEYTLVDPVKTKETEEIILSKVVFKNRYRAHELEANMKGVKPDEFMPMTRAYIATLTGVSRSILGKLWDRDMGVCQAIYTLFTRGES